MFEIILLAVRNLIVNLGTVGLFIIILSMEKYPAQGFMFAIVDLVLVGFCMYLNHIDKVREENNNKWRSHRR